MFHFWLEKNAGRDILWRGPLRTSKIGIGLIKMNSLRWSSVFEVHIFGTATCVWCRDFGFFTDQIWCDQEPMKLYFGHVGKKLYKVELILVLISLLNLFQVKVGDNSAGSMRQNKKSSPQGGPLAIIRVLHMMSCDSQ